MVPSLALKNPQPSTYRSFEMIVPELTSRLNAIHGHLDPEAREEALAEGLAYAYEIYTSSMRRGQAHKITPWSMAVFVAGLFRTGRRFTGSSATDVLGDRTRALKRVHLKPLDFHLEDDESGDESNLPYSDALIDSRHPSPLDATRVNLDFKTMLSDDRVSPKARKAFKHALEDQGEGCNLRLAETLGVSPPRATQLKRELAGVFADYGYTC